MSSQIFGIVSYVVSVLTERAAVSMVRPLGRLQVSPTVDTLVGGPALSTLYVLVELIIIQAPLTMNVAGDGSLA
jgi:hypothetical protein